GGKAAFVHADVTLDSEIQRAITVAEGTFGGLDILVNNAGSYYDPPFYPVAEARDWRRILEVFLTAYMDVMQRAIEAMKRRGDAVVQFVRDESRCGRILLYYEPGKKRLIPTDLDLFELSEEA